MQLTRLAIYRYRYPLPAAIVAGGRSLNFREGIFVKLSTPEHAGWGEIAPLPGFHPWSLERVVEELTHLAHHWKHQPPEISDGQESFEQTLKPVESPIVKLGLDSAYHHLQLQYSSEKENPFGASSHSGVAVQGIVDASPETWEDRCIELANKGFTTIKLKIGRFPPEVVQRYFIRMINRLPQTVQFRLDIQQYWDLKTAIAYFKSLAPFRTRVDYVEDPVDQLTDFAPFYQETGFKVALDVSSETELQTVLDGEIPVHFAVLKPEYWGSWKRYLQIGRQLEQHHIVPVMSNAFTTEWTIAWQVLVGSCWQSQTAHGLGTVQFPQSRLFQQPVFQNKNFFSVNQALHCLQLLNEQQLTPVQEFHL